MFWVGFLLISIKSSSNWKIIIHSNTNKTFLNSLNWFSNLFVDNFPFKGVLLETTCHNNNYARENNFLCHRNAQKIHGGHSDPRPRHDRPGIRQGRRGGIGIILWRRGGLAESQVLGPKVEEAVEIPLCQLLDPLALPTLHTAWQS